MNLPLETFFDRTVRGLLHTYPPAFRRRFGSEMAQVYRLLARQAVQDHGPGGLMRLWLRIVWDGLWGALVQWGQQLTKRRMGSMNLDPLNTSDGTVPLSPRQAALAVLPFLLFGLASIADKLEIVRLGPFPLWQAFLINPELLFNWLILLGLAAGIIAGFPRWAFSYLGWALFFAWWWTNMGIYGIRLKGQIWLPLAAVVIISLLIRRSLQPVRVILTGLWRDLTLLPLGVYILYASLFMIADGNHNPYLVFFIAATTLVTCLGAWGFFRTPSPLRRVLALIGGWALTIPFSIWNSLTWDYRAYYGLPEGSPLDISPIGILFLAGLSLLMLGMAWLMQWRNRRRTAS